MWILTNFKQIKHCPRTTLNGGSPVDGEAWNTAWIAWYPFTCNLETQRSQCLRTHILINGRWELKDTFFSLFHPRSKSWDSLLCPQKHQEIEMLAALDTKQWLTFYFSSLYSLPFNLSFLQPCLPGTALPNYIITHRLFCVRTPVKLLENEPGMFFQGLKELFKSLNQEQAWIIEIQLSS